MFFVKIKISEAIEGKLLGGKGADEGSLWMGNGHTVWRSTLPDHQQN